MSTPYSNIFNVFYGKISDYSFINLTQLDLEGILVNYLKSAIVRFKKCKNDLSNRNDTSKTFNITLTDEEIEILGNIMVYEWLHQYVNTTESICQGFSTKDATRYSQANHLKEMRELRKDTKKDFEKLIVDYTFGNNPLSDLE